MISQKAEYIFWLYGWNNNGSFLSNEDLIKCKVTHKKIQIASDPVKNIPINSIKKCTLYTVGGSTFLRHLIKLEVVKDKKIIDVYIFPANPIKPNNERSNGVEVNAFIELITCLISKRDVKVNPNPYIRNVSKNQIQDKNLDPNISPWVYYHRYRKKTSLSKAVFKIILTFFISFFLLILLAVLVQYLAH